MTSRRRDLCPCHFGRGVVIKQFRRLSFTMVKYFVVTEDLLPMRNCSAPDVDLFVQPIAFSPMLPRRNSGELFDAG